MTTRVQPGTRQTVIAVLLSIAGVFILDGVAPAGLSIWLLYLVPVGLTLRCRHPGASSVVAFLATLGLVTGFFRSHAESAWIDAGARGLGFFVIWTVALLIRERVAPAAVRRDARRRLLEARLRLRAARQQTA